MFLGVFGCVWMGLGVSVCGSVCLGVCELVLVVFGCVRVFPGFIWMCLGVSACMWVCLCVCLDVSGYVWVCLDMSGCVWTCLGLSGCVWESVWVCVIVYDILCERV